MGGGVWVRKVSSDVGDTTCTVEVLYVLDWDHLELAGVYIHVGNGNGL